MTLREVADLVGGEVEGDDSVRIERVASLDEASPSDLTFAADRRRGKQLAHCRAAGALVGRGTPGAGMPLVRVDDVQAALIAVLTAVAPPEDLPPAGVHASAVVAEDALLGEDVGIGPGVVIGAGARIGPRTRVCANAVIGADVAVGADAVLAEGVVVRSRCLIGDRVRIGSNSVIGYEGFGYHVVDGQHRRIPHTGGVVIEDDVEIGACSCVDRAKFGQTRIGRGTKIDNLVQVAHNVQIGPGCILVAQCGLAGSLRAGRNVVIGGHAGLRDNIVIGDGARVSACACVAGDVPAGETVAGTPAGPLSVQRRVWVALRKLPDLLKRVASLESRLGKLDAADDD